MSLNPQDTYILLEHDGIATPVPGGAQFWLLSETDSAKASSGWLVSEYCFDTDWPTWEMHPHGDEFIYLLAGSVQLLIEDASGVRIVAMRENTATIVRRGLWHTAKIAVPSRMLHITRGAGTLTRP